MKVVLVLIIIVLVHLSLADNSKSLVKEDSSDSEYGESIVKPLERSVREGRKGENRNNKQQVRRNSKLNTKRGKNQKAPSKNRANKQASKIEKKRKRTQQRRIKKKPQNKRKNKQNKRKNKQNKRKTRKPKDSKKNNKKLGKSAKSKNRKNRRRNNKKSLKSKNKNDNRKSKQRTKKTKSHNRRKKSKKERKNADKNKRNKKGTVKEKKGDIKQPGKKIVRQGADCSFDDMVTLIKNNTRNINTLAQLRRIVRNLKRLAGKSLNAMTTFTNASAAISAATSDGTTCNCDSTSAPEEARVANEQLKNCSTTAPAKCSNASIVYTKAKPNCTNCTIECPNPACETKTCTKCPKDTTEYTLTPAMVAHINDICIPQLEKWTKRYKACSTTTTYTNCTTDCSPKGVNTVQYTCQQKTCVACSPTAPETCAYDTCLAGAANDSNIRDCQCDECFKKLGDQYPISTTKVGGLNCYGIAKFERKTKERRDECQEPTADNLSGNFGDCRYQERQTPFYINKCVGPYVCTSTTKATFRRNRFLAELQMLRLQNKWRK